MLRYVERPHNPLTRTLQPITSTTCWHGRDSAGSVWCKAAASTNVVAESPGRRAGSNFHHRRECDIFLGSPTRSFLRSTIDLCKISMLGVVALLVR